MSIVVVDVCIYRVCSFFFFNDTATTEIYTLSLHDALPISAPEPRRRLPPASRSPARARPAPAPSAAPPRSEEHTSELQSQFHLVCRLLLEKKKQIRISSLQTNNFNSSDSSLHFESKLRLRT